MTPLAVVILAHADPAHFGRLVTALEDTPIVTHCDARTPDVVFERMAAGGRGRVRFVRRRRTTLASWSLVGAELDALREALRWTAARHIAVLSGADYPLLSMPDLIAELDHWSDRSWMHSVPLPHRDWDTPRHPDGGLWRLRYRYLTRDDQVLFWRGYPLRWPVPRRVPADLTLRAASQWKIYSRRDAAALLDLVGRRPDLMRFWRTTLVPDECFAASMLASPALLGDAAVPQQATGAWYIDWGERSTGHPRWLTGTDFDRLKLARWATPLRPGAAADEAAGQPPRPGAAVDEVAGQPTRPGAAADEAAGHRKLFARKFRSTDPDVLDRVDHELRA